MENKGTDRRNERKINANVVLNGTRLETVHGAAIYLESKIPSDGKVWWAIIIRDGSSVR